VWGFTSGIVSNAEVLRPSARHVAMQGGLRPVSDGPNPPRLCHSCESGNPGIPQPSRSAGCAHHLYRQPPGRDESLHSLPLAMRGY
jgi:hypothetical protein